MGARERQKPSLSLVVAGGGSRGVVLPCVQCSVSILVGNPFMSRFVLSVTVIALPYG